MKEFDVIICGAGPAGTTCALALFESGLNVALLDKSTFPRDKICGDAVGSYIYKILDTISPIFSKKILDFNKVVKINYSYLISKNGQRHRFRLNEHYLSIQRVHFDNFLLDLVKAETKTSIFENTLIQKVNTFPDYIILTSNSGEQFKCKILVGCDGVHSVARSALTNCRELLTDSYPAVRAYYKNVKNIEQNSFEYYFLKEIPKGYFWIFPSVDGISNIGIGSDKKSIKKSGINLRKKMTELLENSPMFKDRFENAELVGDIKGWTIPVGLFNGDHKVSGKRILLCGDAASIVDPLTGEGIGPAMSTGRYAGKHIIKCFKENNFSDSFLNKYDLILKKKYKHDYFYKKSLAFVFDYFPFIFNLLIFIKSKIYRK